MANLDTLYNEIISIQLYDRKIENNEIYSDECYYRPEHKKVYELRCINTEELDDEDNLTTEVIAENDFEEVVEGKIYTYDEVMDELFHEIDIYNFIYELPELSITKDEWDLFFETVAKYYYNQDFRYSFMEDMINLNRLALARSLVYEEEYLNIDSYVASLVYMESDYLTYNHIGKIVKRLNKGFNVDFTYLVTKEDGGIGCVGRGDRYFLINEIKYQDYTKEQLHEILESANFTEANCLIVRNSKNKELNSDTDIEITYKNNIVNFNAYKAKRKQKK